jgi:hypothetical protein
MIEVICLMTFVYLDYFSNIFEKIKPSKKNLKKNKKKSKTLPFFKKNGKKGSLLVTSRIVSEDPKYLYIYL